MLDPDVLLLDEPLGDLDPMIRADLQEDLRDDLSRAGQDGGAGDARPGGGGVPRRPDRAVARRADRAARLVRRAGRAAGRRVRRQIRAGPAAASWRDAQRASIVVGVLASRGDRAALRPPPRGVRVASKQFTEARHPGRDRSCSCFARASVEATHIAELGGTTLVFDALAPRRDRHVPRLHRHAPEGNLRRPRRATPTSSLPTLLRSRRRRDEQARWASATTTRWPCAARRPSGWGSTTIDDLATHPELRLGLQQRIPRPRRRLEESARSITGCRIDAVGMQHDLAYQQLAAGTIDVTDVYTTDAKVAELDLVMLDGQSQLLSAVRRRRAVARRSGRAISRGGRSDRAARRPDDDRTT